MALKKKSVWEIEMRQDQEKLTNSGFASKSKGQLYTFSEINHSDVRNNNYKHLYYQNNNNNDI